MRTKKKHTHRHTQTQTHERRSKVEARKRGVETGMERKGKPTLTEALAFCGSLPLFFAISAVHSTCLYFEVCYSSCGGRDRLFRPFQIGPQTQAEAKRRGRRKPFSFSVQTGWPVYAILIHNMQPRRPPLRTLTINVIQKCSVLCCNPPVSNGTKSDGLRADDASHRHRRDELPQEQHGAVPTQSFGVLEHAQGVLHGKRARRPSYVGWPNARQAWLGIAHDMI